MPRRARVAPGGVVFHVLNRANGRLRLFKKDADYLAFERLLVEAHDRVPIRILDWCLMPNHWHLVLWPRRDGELTDFLRWLTLTHAQRWKHAHAAVGHGHLYQGRFKSFPVDDDERYLLALLRYVESNPLRARPPLARGPRGWRWTSFAARGAAWAEEIKLLDEWPVDLPPHWEALLAEALPDEGPDSLAALRTAAARGRPFGRDKWVKAAAERLGLQFTLRPRGRPPGPKADAESKSGIGRRGGAKGGAKASGAARAKSNADANAKSKRGTSARPAARAPQK
jgi:putative transposase